MVIKERLRELNKGVAEFGRDIGVNRVTALRIANGQRFGVVKPLFQKIFDTLGLTPNDILEIHPEQKSFKK